MVCLQRNPALTNQDPVHRLARLLLDMRDKDACWLRCIRGITSWKLRPGKSVGEFPWALCHVLWKIHEWYGVCACVCVGGVGMGGGVPGGSCASSASGNIYIYAQKCQDSQIYYRSQAPDLINIICERRWCCCTLSLDMHVNRICAGTCISPQGCNYS